MSTTSSFISEPLAIESLIVDRSRVLDLRRPDLMRRAGYKNTAKGLRRLDELLAGDLDKTRGLIRALPAALDVPPEVVEHAIDETRRRIIEAQEAARQAREAAWRAAFRPHAIILTERTVPHGNLGYYAGIDRKNNAMSNVSIWESIETAEQMATFQPMIDLAGAFVALGVRFQRPILNCETVWEIP